MSRYHFIVRKGLGHNPVPFAQGLVTHSLSVGQMRKNFKQDFPHFDCLPVRIHCSPRFLLCHFAKSGLLSSVEKSGLTTPGEKVLVTRNQVVCLRCRPHVHCICKIERNVPPGQLKQKSFGGLKPPLSYSLFHDLNYNP